MGKVINSGALVKVTEEGHEREGQAGMALGESVGQDNDTVTVRFDLDDAVVAGVPTDSLQVLG
jgi:hypothetical protein